MTSLHLQSILNESNTECPVLNMSAAIAYYRKMVNNEELGKSIEFMYMRVGPAIDRMPPD